MATTIPSSDPSALLAALMAENEALKAKAAAGKRVPKQEPATIKPTGLVHFPGIMGLNGASFNPDAFVSVLARLGLTPEIVMSAPEQFPLAAEFCANEAEIRTAYAAYVEERDAKQAKPASRWTKR